MQNDLTVAEFDKAFSSDKRRNRWSRKMELLLASIHKDKSTVELAIIFDKRKSAIHEKLNLTGFSRLTQEELDLYGVLGVSPKRFGEKTEDCTKEVQRMRNRYPSK